MQTLKDETRIALKLIYKIIEKIPTENLIHHYPATYNLAVMGVIGSIPERNLEDSLFTQLKTIFEKDDAEHIFQAIKSECDYFLTVDYSTILNRVEINKKILHDISPRTQIVDPIQLLQIVQNTDQS